MYPQPGNQSQRYNVVQQPFPRGLAAPFGHCTDGVTLWWWAKDGIYSSTKGSLTDADLLTLFPHDGSRPRTTTTTASPSPPPTTLAPSPSGSRSPTDTCTPPNEDVSGVARNLVYDTRRGAWSVDAYTLDPVTVFYHPHSRRER